MVQLARYELMSECCMSASSGELIGRGVTFVVDLCSHNRRDRRVGDHLDLGVLSEGFRLFPGLKLKQHSGTRSVAPSFEVNTTLCAGRRS